MLNKFEKISVCDYTDCNYVFCMKKWVIVIFCCFVSSFCAAQVDLGIQVSPSLSFNRLHETSDTADLSSKGTGAKLQAGLVADFLLTKSYYFSTGVFFVPKKISLQDNRTPSVTEEFHVQYLQFPAMLKLYTEEIALDTRIFVQSGFTAEVKIDDKSDTPEPAYLGNFRTVNASWVIGAGLEYRIGYSTTVFGGFSYRRGLVNAIASPLQPMDGDLSIKTDFLSLDLGIKF